MFMGLKGSGQTIEWSYLLPNSYRSMTLDACFQVSSDTLFNNQTPSSLVASPTMESLTVSKVGDSNPSVVH